MLRLFLLATCLFGPVVEVASAAEPSSVKFEATDWPWWRGPQRDGHAADGQTPPTSWSPDENIVWKSPVTGRGHGSPIVVGDRVILLTADVKNGTQSVVCYSRSTGKEPWSTVVHRGGLVVKGKKKPNKKASWASSTPACDGDWIFVNFYNDNAIYTTALNLNGEQVWQKKISDYVVHQGYGASPAIYGKHVIVSTDNKGGGRIAALDRETGHFVWQLPRPDKPNYASPIILRANDRDQLVFTGCDLVASYDPATGKKLWEAEGSTTECVTSVVTDGKHVFTSGGYPQNHVSAMLADGSGKIAWQNNSRVYVPSMFVHDGYLYGTKDEGVAMCWECATGKEMWKGRLGGTFSSSPVKVGELVFATNEAGTTFVYELSPKKFELVSENKLGDFVMATPTYVGGQIFMRVVEGHGEDLSEVLYCIGKK